MGMHKASRILLQVILLGWSGPLLAASNTAPVDVPPEPAHPQRQGMTKEQFDEAWQKWRTEHEAWEAHLTAEQFFAQRNREREDNAKEQERYRREERLPLPADGYDWKKAAEQRKLAPGTMASLERHQIAFGDSAKQSFSPYLGGPVFITSDSLLNGFHVLFEDSFRELELRHAAGFRKEFEGLLSAMRKIAGQNIVSPERFAAGSRQAHLAIGPALVLCGTPLEFFDESLRGEIQAQVDKIRAADKVELPAWLAPADPAAFTAIDYRRCKPVGFYAEPRLADYFRATRWLQMVPFRAGREPEFDGILLLGLAARDSKLEDALRSYSRLVGPPDDPTMLELQAELDNSYPRNGGNFDQQLRSVRVGLVRRLIDRGYYRINSDLRMRTTLENTFPQLTFRVIATSALPDAVLFQRLLDRDLKPSGLAVAAMLGSAFAEGRLAANEQAVVTQGKALLGDDALRPDGRSGGLIYFQYLNALNALFLAPAPEAPVFMKGEVWSAKSCQTALAGWAQMRHTFTLQAKMSEYYLGLVMVPPGFVEANPEFFARMARLIENTQDTLERGGYFGPSAFDEADDLRKQVEFLRSAKLDQPDAGFARLENLAGRGMILYQNAVQNAFGPQAAEQAMEHLWKASKEEFLRYQRDLVAALSKRADALERGEVEPKPSESNLRQRWIDLARIARTLEAMAHKELRGQSWTEPEERFLKSYGETMAGIMGYYGNSWLTPRDDAPRWAEVAGFPDRSVSLAAAIGRPRYIYVLYPWNGIDVLCVGSVMQYYEYESPGRLTDGEWLRLLDSAAAPALPAWLALYAPPPAQPPERGH